MNKGYTLAGIFLLLLTGCSDATPKDLVDSKPLIQEVTKKTEDKQTAISENRQQVRAVSNDGNISFSSSLFGEPYRNDNTLLVEFSSKNDVIQFENVVPTISFSFVDAESEEVLVTKTISTVPKSTEDNRYLVSLDLTDIYKELPNDRELHLKVLGSIESNTTSYELINVIKTAISRFQLDIYVQEGSRQISNLNKAEQVRLTSTSGGYINEVFRSIFSTNRPTEVSIVKSELTVYDAETLKTIQTFDYTKELIKDMGDEKVAAVDMTLAEEQPENAIYIIKDEVIFTANNMEHSISNTFSLSPRIEKK